MKFENRLHFFAYAKKHGIFLTEMQRITIANEFEMARLRCELPLALSVLKSIYTENN